MSDKDKWISSKISTLVKEGKPHKQAVAIAISMWNKEHKQEGGVNLTGYLEGSATENNNYNIIPSNQITMKGVKNTILGMKLDKDGNFIGMKFMKPDKDYDFEDAMSVLEIPKYQSAGMHGLPFDLLNLPEEGTMLQYDANGNPISVPNPGVLSEEETKTQNKIFQQMSGQGEVNPLFNTPDPLETEVAAMEEEDYLKDLEEDFSVESFTDEKSIGNSFLPSSGNKVSIDDKMKEEYDKSKGSYDKDYADMQEESFKLDVNQMKNKRFLNPYGGVDIPTAASIFGESLQKKDVMGSITSGAKVLAGLGRIGLGGYAKSKMDEWVTNEYQKKLQRQNETYVSREGGQYFKKGGVSKEELLTGNYITGVDQDTQAHMANAEVEKGEYIKTNQGDVAEVLGNKHSQGGELIPLDQGERVLSDYDKIGARVAQRIRNDFDLDVKAKDTYAKVIKRFESKMNFPNLLKEEESYNKQYERVKDMLDSQTKGLNLSYLDKRLSEVKEQKKPIEEARSMLFDKIFEMQEMAKPEAERAPQFRSGGKRMYQPGGQGKQRLEDFYTQLQRLYGYEGDFNMEADDLGPEAGKLQRFLVEKNPQSIIDYFRNGQPINSKGIAAIQSNAPQVFKQLGLDASKKPADYTREERLAIQDAYNAEVMKLAKETSAEKGDWEKVGRDTMDRFYLDQYQDDMWDYRFPVIGAPTLPNKQVEGTYPDPLYDTPIHKELLNTKHLDEEWYKKAKLGYTTEVSKDDIRDNKSKEASNLMLLPEQHANRPDAMDAHLMVQRRFDMVDPAQIDPIPYMKELDTGLDAAIAQIDASGLRPEVAEAARSNVRAEYEKRKGEVMTKIDTTNLIAKQQADQLKTETQRMQENASGQDRLSYEQRQLTAKAKQKWLQDEYYDKMSQTNLGNFMTIDALNRSNEMFSDVQATGTSSFDVNTPEGFRNMLGMIMAMQAAQDREQETTQGKKNSNNLA